MTDFRALCIELTDCLEKADWPLRYRYVFRQWVDIARAALADEPAVPEGREPASVTGQPSDEAWDALVERAWDKYQTVGYLGERFMYDRDFGNALEFVRQGLTLWGNPAPQPPAEGEVAEFITQIKSYAEYGTPIRLIPFVVKRAADLLQRLSPPQPVPVSERLPGAEDCDAEGRYWGLINGCEAWVLGKGSPSTLNITHWLPAQALPLPGQEVEG